MVPALPLDELKPRVPPLSVTLPKPLAPVVWPKAVLLVPIAALVVAIAQRLGDAPASAHLLQRRGRQLILVRVAVERLHEAGAVGEPLRGDPVRGQLGGLVLRRMVRLDV